MEVLTFLYSRTSTNSHLYTMVTFLVDSPYIDSCLNLSKMATFFCPQSGRCGEVQLYTIFHLKKKYPPVYVHWKMLPVKHTY